MNNAAKLLVFTLTALPFALPVYAKQITKADIIANHNACLRFMKLPRARQLAIATRWPVSADTYLKSCRFTTRMGIEKTWYYERMYQREMARGGSSHSAPAPRREESSPATSGTCYDLSSCAGSSVHVSAKYNCPGGWGSFKPDHGGGGCETR